jgi:hypothetical protein
MSDKDERAARLAAQLRTNLHRRKAQARAATRPAEGDDVPPLPTDDPRD